MLINSKFKDYYDNIMSVGIDRDCVYIRKTEKICHDKEIVFHLLNSPSNKLAGYIFTPFLIGFCGKIYPVVRVSKIEIAPKKPTHVHLYSLEDYAEYLSTNNIKIKVDRRSYGRGVDTEEGLKHFFNKDYKKLEIIFMKYKAPVFSIEHDEDVSPNNWGYRPIVLILNPKLKDFDFIRVKDPFTAFQEIFMFKAGVLGNPEKEIITISDKDKAKQHGHDGKYSFKKPPKEK